jgi:hypothetical protein
VRVILKPEPDGMGYLYGEAVSADGERFSVYILPPRNAWHGDDMSNEIDPTKWVVYIGG